MSLLLHVADQEHVLHRRQQLTAVVNKSSSSNSKKILC